MARARPGHLVSDRSTHERCARSTQHRNLPVLGGKRDYAVLRVNLGRAPMRLVPNTDTVPASVNRYLLPHERQVITVHQHPAILIKPIFWVLIGLALACWLSNSIASGNGLVLLVIWILWGILFLNLAVK